MFSFITNHSIRVLTVLLLDEQMRISSEFSYCHQHMELIMRIFCPILLHSEDICPSPRDFILCQ